MRNFIHVSTISLLWMFLVSLTFATTFGNGAVWTQDVPDGGVFTDTVPEPDVVWNLDDGTGYLFTAVVADKKNEYVYTARSQFGSWDGPAGTLQKWDASTGELVGEAVTCSCGGVYDLELVYGGSSAAAPEPTELHVYKADTSTTNDTYEIYDPVNLSLMGSGIWTAPSSGNSQVALKREKTRDDGISVKVKHYYSSIGTYNSPGSGQNGQVNQLGIYENDNDIAYDQYSNPAWSTDVVPAPTTQSQYYFGAEAVALSPAGDYLYIAGGTKSGSTYGSRLQKIELDTPPAPTASISANPASVYIGGDTLLSWSSSYADYCEITSPVWNSGVVLADGYEVDMQVINANTIFTITCTRESDGATAVNQTTVAIQQPVAVADVTAPPAYLTPSSNLTITPTTEVYFDASGSLDQSGGTNLVYEWRRDNCTTGTVINSASSFNQTFSTGGYNIYLRVQDVGTGVYSTNCPLITIFVPPQCSDGINNNDGDSLIDANDPGCWTDPANSATYDANDNDEGNCGNGVCEKSSGENPFVCKQDCRVIFREN